MFCAMTSLSEFCDLWPLNCYLNPYGLYNYLVISSEGNQLKNSVLPSLDIVVNFKEAGLKTHVLYVLRTYKSLSPFSKEM